MQITDGELREWLNFLLLMSLNRRIHELMHDKYIVREIVKNLKGRFRILNPKG